MGKSILIKASSYRFSTTKRIFDIAVSLIGFVVLSPIILVISILIKLTSKGSVFFIQKRIGIRGKSFNIIKFRTMKKSAVLQQWRYKRQNEADGPVFKIWDDPRFTGFGRLLSRTGLDELPQLINVLKGNMSLVGPRPLPVSEANKLTITQRQRHLIKPGLTSLWVIRGAHSLSFAEWMKLDQVYVGKASFVTDLNILLKTASIILNSILTLIFTDSSAQVVSHQTKK